VYNTQQSKKCEVSTEDRQTDSLNPSTVSSLPSPVQSLVGITTDDDSDGDSNTCDTSINNATFTLASSKHLGSPTSFHQTPAVSADPHSSSQHSPFSPSGEIFVELLQWLQMEYIYIYLIYVCMYACK